MVRVEYEKKESEVQYEYSIREEGVVVSLHIVEM